MDIPTCSKCSRDLFGFDAPCTCAKQTRENVVEMLEYLQYVMEETAAALRQKAGAKRSRVNKKLHYRAELLERTTPRLCRWIEEVGS